MDFLFDMIRSSSHDSIWFWVLVVVTLTQAGARVLGVPWDLAARMWDSETIAADVRILVRIWAQRYVNLSGQWVWGLLAFVLTSLGMLGFVYNYTMAQAMFLLLTPLSGIWMLNLRMAVHYLREQPEDKALYSMLRRHRWRVQIIIVIATVIIALWGGVQSVLNSTFV